MCSSDLGRLVPELIGLGALLLVSALLSGAEAAYFSLGRTRLTEIAGVVPAIANFPDGCRFNPRCAKATNICRTTTPETTWLDAGGLVRCHHHA